MVDHTGRDQIIITKALGYAIVAIERLPIEWQEQLDFERMKTLLMARVPRADFRDSVLNGARIHLTGEDFPADHPSRRSVVVQDTAMIEAVHITAEELADELDHTAWWRGEKAAQYPDDTRNAVSAATLTELAAKMSEADETSEAFRVFDTFWQTVAMDENEGLDYSRASSEYRSRIGFEHFPDTPEEYLHDLMTLRR